MKDSLTLQLVMSAGVLQDHISTMLVSRLHQHGHEAINVSRLAFLSQLECGVNYASDVARKLSVSRQMVAKTVKELCELGYLEQHQDLGKKKVIVFTVLGETLIAACRDELAQLDDCLLKTHQRGSIINSIQLMQSLSSDHHAKGNR